MPLTDGWTQTENKQLVCHRTGKDVLFVTYGCLVHQVLLAAQKLEAKGIAAGVLRITNLSELPVSEIAAYLQPGTKVIVVEEITHGSGIGQALSCELTGIYPDCIVRIRDLGSDFVPHGSQQQLYSLCGLDGDSLAEYAEGVLSHEK